jgi:type IX secretion system PorP/SprF family membrane protein
MQEKNKHIPILLDGLHTYTNNYKQKVHHIKGIAFLIAIITSLMSTIGFAQDLHFSQFYNAPLLCNPANTGFMPDADYRFGMNYRKQWASIPVPYKTMSAFGDVQVGRNKMENGWFGLGAMFFSDQAGTGALQSTKAYASVAYHQIVGEGSLISGGFQLGMVQKSINPAKLTFDNMWNGKFFDINAPSGETFATNNIRYLDLNLGVNYAAFPTEESYLNFGLSAQHINRPKESFFDGVLPDSSRYDNKLSRRYTAFFNGSFKLNDMVIVNPQAYISYMAKAVEVNGGINMQYNLTGDGASQLIGGIYYRFKDAVIPMLGVKHKSITATFTYDGTVSKLGSFNKIRGGSEISIIYQGVFNQYNGRRDTRCKSPSF